MHGFMTTHELERRVCSYTLWGEIALWIRQSADLLPRQGFGPRGPKPEEAYIEVPARICNVCAY